MSLFLVCLGGWAMRQNLEPVLLGALQAGSWLEFILYDSMSVYYCALGGFYLWRGGWKSVGLLLGLGTSSK